MVINLSCVIYFYFAMVKFIKSVLYNSTAKKRREKVKLESHLKRMKWSGVSCPPKESQPLLFREEPHKALWSHPCYLTFMSMTSSIAWMVSSAFDDDLPTWLESLIW